MDKIQPMIEILKNTELQANVIKNVYIFLTKDRPIQEETKIIEKQEKIITELLQKIVQFCNQSQTKLSIKKTAALIYVIYEVHSKEYLSPMDAFNSFKDLLLQFTIHRPPFSLAIFAYQDLKPVTYFVITEYFKNYKEYQSIFAKEEKKIEVDIPSSIEKQEENNIQNIEKQKENNIKNMSN